MNADSRSSSQSVLFGVFFVKPIQWLLPSRHIQSYPLRIGYLQHDLSIVAIKIELKHRSCWGVLASRSRSVMRLACSMEKNDFGTVLGSPDGFWYSFLKRFQQSALIKNLLTQTVLLHLGTCREMPDSSLWCTLLFLIKSQATRQTGRGNAKTQRVSVSYLWMYRNYAADSANTTYITWIAYICCCFIYSVYYSKGTNFSFFSVSK